MSIDQKNDFQDYSLTAALTMSFMTALRFAVAGAESKTNEAIRKSGGATHNHPRNSCF